MPSTNRSKTAKSTEKQGQGGRVSRETVLPQARIALINQKGGVGKTTTAVSLAHGLALAGKRVLLMDLDPQGNASTALGVDKFSEKSSAYEYLMEPGSMRKDFWLSSAYERLDVLPSNISLVGAESEFMGKDPKQRNLLLRQAIKETKPDHDFVIFDAPPSLGVMTMNILSASNYVIVPVQCEFLALEGLSMLLETLEEIRSSQKTKLMLLGCVLTMVDLRTNLAQQVIKDMRSHLGKKVMKTLIPRTVRLSECPSHGKTIYDYERWGAGARAYESLTKEVLARLGAIHRKRSAAES